VIKKIADDKILFESFKINIVTLQDYMQEL